jgi:hypothetical protein
MRRASKKERGANSPGRRRAAHVARRLFAVQIPALSSCSISKLAMGSPLYSSDSPPFTLSHMGFSGFTAKQNQYRLCSYKRTNGPCLKQWPYSLSALSHIFSVLFKIVPTRPGKFFNPTPYRSVQVKGKKQGLKIQF